MAISFINQPVGATETYLVSPSDLFYVPGDPGVTYTKGDFLSKTAVGATAKAGTMVAAADSDAGALLIVEKTVTVPAATACGFPYGDPLNPSYLADDDSNVANTLVPCSFVDEAYIKVRVVPFAGHADDVIATYTAATPSVTLTTALGADDDPNGGLIYIYDGPGAGQWNQIVDYANGTKVATLIRKFEVAPTSASSCIILEGGGSSVGGAGILGRIDLDDDDNLDCTDGADDGDYIILLDARQVASFLRRGCLPVAKYSKFA